MIVLQLMILTDCQDKKLIEAVKISRNEDYIHWEKVASHVGEGITADQCNKRWVRNIRPENEQFHQGPWTSEEVILQSITTSTTAVAADDSLFQN